MNFFVVVMILICGWYWEMWVVVDDFIVTEYE